ncbi:MAG: hypothetical protein ACOC5R_01085 [Elusimicrobiota bacterium]
MPRVKISGITNVDDAKWAAILGVEFVSVSLDEESEKKVSIEMAEEIKSVLPSYTKMVCEYSKPVDINSKHINKIAPDYIQFNGNGAAQEEAKRRMKDMTKPLIIECDQNTDISTYDELDDYIMQVNLYQDYENLDLSQLKEKFNMDKIIIQADWALEEIKKVCQSVHPFAWSVEKIIQRSPRRINYEKMKEYIREISIW